MKKFSAPFDLTGRVFLIVGGAQFLGRDMATALSEAGAEGIITSRDLSRAEKTAKEISERSGRTVRGWMLDACDESAIQSVLKRVEQEFGRLDILVNNVGGGAGSMTQSTALETRSLEAWELLQRTNVTAPFLVCKHAAPLMKRQRTGSIINIASIAGLVGRDRRVYPKEMAAQSIDYAAAKGAVIAMTRDLAALFGPFGVRVNVISPGGFERGQPPAFIQAYSAKVPLGRMGRDGHDLCGPVLFLASDASAYVTGHNLVVDGGFTAWQ
ncbi:MAG TPA: SDR family oxidoreductase [Opitutaceae bacterium]|nr:SDR family oxidoreductase [Opitutaceae bacterium]